MVTVYGKQYHVGDASIIIIILLSLLSSTGSTGQEVLPAGSTKGPRETVSVVQTFSIPVF